jgi:hypothetical protein
MRAEGHVPGPMPWPGGSFRVKIGAACRQGSRAAERGKFVLLPITESPCGVASCAATPSAPLGRRAVGGTAAAWTAARRGAAGRGSTGKSAGGGLKMTPRNDRAQLGVSAGKGRDWPHATSTTTFATQRHSPSSSSGNVAPPASRGTGGGGTAAGATRFSEGCASSRSAPVTRT